MNTSTATNKDALLRAIAVIGSQTAFGAVLGKKQGFVSYWVKTGRLPVEHCPDIEEETRAKGDVVTCEELRPDVNWRALRKQPRKQKPLGAAAMAVADKKGGAPEPATPTQSDRRKEDVEAAGTDGVHLVNRRARG